MDIFWLLVIFACLGVVLYWYVVNEASGEDGTAGFMALISSSVEEAAARSGISYVTRRRRARDEMVPRKRDKRAGNPPLNGDTKSYKETGKAYRETGPRYRVRATPGRYHAKTSRAEKAQTSADDTPRSAPKSASGSIRASKRTTQR